MRALGSLALAAAVVALPSLVSGLAPYDGRYVGLMTCDVLPGQTNLRLSGSQLWRLPGRSVLTRSCTIGVQRSGD